MSTIVLTFINTLYFLTLIEHFVFPTAFFKTTNFFPSKIMQGKDLKNPSSREYIIYLTIVMLDHVKVEGQISTADRFFKVGLSLPMTGHTKFHVHMIVCVRNNTDRLSVLTDHL